MATTSSNPPQVYERRGLRVDLAGVCAAIALFIQLVVAAGAFWGLRQQVADMKETNNSTFQRIEQEIKDLRTDITGKKH